MPRQPYYPKNHGDQPEWHTNFATKLPGHGPSLPLTPAQVDAGVADNLILAYGLGGWILSTREFGTGCTASLTTLCYGGGGTNFVFPVHQAPALPELPAGITGVKPGALQRTFDLAQLIKRSPGFTDAIGLDLGIIGSEAPPPPPGGEAPPPRITVTVIPGDTHERGRIKFVKDGHEYLQLESRRGTGGWEEIGLSNKSPFIDERPLLVAGQAEVREYRGRHWDNGSPISAWCDVAKVTIGP